MTQTLVRAGFDTIEYSVFGKVPDSFLQVLNEAKQKAAASKAPYPLNWKGTPVLVEPNGGRGGFAYMISTGLLGVKIRFREIGSTQPFCAHITLSAHGLATKGLLRLKAECDNLFELIGSVTDAQRTLIGRMDYAFDFCAPNLKLEASHFVCHARTVKSEVIERTSVGDRINYLRIGKMPGAQACIYNKGRQISQERDLVWRDIYSTAAEKLIPDTDINDWWRAEFRLGKSAIDKFQPHRQWDNVLSQAATAIKEVSDYISWRVETSDSNRSRWPVHPVWIQVQNYLANSFAEFVPIEISEATKRRIAEDYISGLESQCEGLILTIAAAYSIEASAIEKFVASHFSGIARRLSERDDLEDQLRTRQARQIMLQRQSKT